MQLSSENYTRIVAVAQRLDDRNAYTFIGGAVLALYFTDPGASQPRSTVDVDVVTPPLEVLATCELEARLRRLGFSHCGEPGAPLCRWLLEGIIVDVMPPNAGSYYGFTNRWYEACRRNRELRSLRGTDIYIAAAPAYLATKLEAYLDRGKGHSASKDLQDVVSLLDAREELVEEVRAFPEGSLVSFVRESLSEIVEEMSEDLESYLYEPERLELVLARLEALAR